MYEYRPLSLLPRGKLEDISIADLLYACCVTSFTGVMSILQDDVEKQLFIVDGCLAYVESDLRTETLGAYLQKNGRISSVEHRLIIERMRQTGRRQGDLFLEEGILTPHDLFDELLGHVRSKVLSCFSWIGGSFELSPGVHLTEGVLNLRIDLCRLILDGVQKIESEVLLEPLTSFGSFVSAFLRVDAPPRTQSLMMNTTEARIYDLVATGSTLAEIDRRTGGTPLSNRQILFGFYILQIIGFNDENRPSMSSIPAHTPIPQRFDESTEDLSTHFEEASEKVLADYIRLADLDYFSLLGVSREATTQDIHKAFREKSTHYSPKEVKNLPPLVAEKAHEIYQRFLNAYKILSNSASRREYLESLDSWRKDSRISSNPPPTFESDELLIQARDDLDKENHEMALEKLRNALKIKPGEPLYEAYLGWALFVSSPSSNRKKAERHLEMARRAQPDMAEPYLFMARIYEHGKQKERAISLYREAGAKAGGDIDITREARLGEVRLRKGRTKSFRPTDADSAAEKNPTRSNKDADRTDSALNMDVGQFIKGLFSKDK